MNGTSELEKNLSNVLALNYAKSFLEDNKKIRFFSVIEGMRCIKGFYNYNGNVYVEARGVDYLLEVSTLYMMKSTGYKDKNGKEIFKDDIVKVYKKNKNKGYARIELDNEEIFICENYGKIKYLKDTCENLEIVGNIYNNPDLASKKIKISLSDIVGNQFIARMILPFAVDLSENIKKKIENGIRCLDDRMDQQIFNNIMRSKK